MIDFAVDGDLRFLSHQEMLRLFGRACTRARVPLRHTRGFNPRPRISLPLPRPVGIASDAERAVVDLSEPIDSDALLDQLGGQMPEGISLLNVQVVEGRMARVPQRACYSIQIADADRSRVCERAAVLLRFAPIWYERVIYGQTKPKRIDLRPYIDFIDLVDGELRFGLHVTGGGAAKPAEICEILGVGGSHVNHLIRRRTIEWR